MIAADFGQKFVRMVSVCPASIVVQALSADSSCILASVPILLVSKKDALILPDSWQYALIFLLSW